MLSQSRNSQSISSCTSDGYSTFIVIIKSLVNPKFVVSVTVHSRDLYRITSTPGRTSSRPNREPMQVHSACKVMTATQVLLTEIFSEMDTESRCPGSRISENGNKCIGPDTMPRNRGRTSQEIT